MIQKKGKKKKDKAIEKQFIALIKDSILPLFPGAEITTNNSINVPLKGQKHCSILQGNTSLAIRKELTSTPIVIKRRQPFIGEDSSIVESFVSRICKFQKSGKIGVLYQDVISKRCLEMSIFDVLSQGYPKVLFYITNILYYWQNRTYEGNKVAISIKISHKTLNSKDGEKLIEKEKLYKEDFFASITNGISDCVEVDENLNIIKYEVLKKSFNENAFAPIKFIDFCDCSRDSVILALTRANEILCFSEGALKLAKRGDYWTLYQHETVIKQLAGGQKNSISKKLRACLYQTALDVSFSKTGGLLACIDKKKLNDSSVVDVFIDDDLRTSSKLRSDVFRRIIAGRKFQDLPRVLRTELAAIDGSFIIDSSGNILAIGAIVRLNGGSSSGGRKAATLALSHFGLAIKISNDSYIECYKDENLLCKI